MDEAVVEAVVEERFFLVLRSERDGRCQGDELAFEDDLESDNNLLDEAVERRQLFVGRSGVLSEGDLRFDRFVDLYDLDGYEVA